MHDLGHRALCEVFINRNTVVTLIKSTNKKYADQDSNLKPPDP